MHENAERFQEILAKRADLREQIAAAAAAYDGDRSDDRAVFEAVVAPVALEAGLRLTYDEALEAATDGRELTDEELEMVAGGAGGFYRVLVSGLLAATMTFGAIPASAFGQEAGSDEQVRVELVAEQQAALDAIDYSPNFSMSDIALPDGVAATPEGLVATNDAGRELLSLSAASGDGFVTWSNAETAVEYATGKLGFVDEDAKKVASLGKALFDVVKGGATGDLGSILAGGKAFLVLTGAIEGEDSGPSNADLMGEIKELNSLVTSMSTKLDDNIKATYQNRLTIFDNAVAALNTECAKVEGMYQKGYELAQKRGLLERGEEPQPPTETELPAEPQEPQMPAEPQEPELPAEPQAAEGQTADSQAEYEQAHAAWQAECDQLRADYEQARLDWQAECDRLRADYDQALATWQAECDQIRADNQKATEDYEARHAEWEEYSTTKALRILMRAEDDKGTSGFTDFKNLMNSIRTNFEIVADECAKGGGSSPFHAFDSYWALHFNFDTQGYYLRQAYRTNAEYQLKRAYSLIGLYFDLPTELETNPDEPFTLALKNALIGIEEHPAGNSPESVRGQSTGLASFYYNVPVHCYTLNRDFKRTGVYNSMATMASPNSYINDKQLEAFCARLHGRTIAEDLRLAGVMADWSDEWAKKGAAAGEKITPDGYLGLGLRHEVKSHAFSANEWITYYVPFDAKGPDIKSYDTAGRSDYRHMILNLNTA